MTQSPHKKQQTIKDCSPYRILKKLKVNQNLTMAHKITQWKLTALNGHQITLFGAKGCDPTQTGAHIHTVWGVELHNINNKTLSAFLTLIGLQVQKSLPRKWSLKLADAKVPKLPTLTFRLPLIAAAVPEFSSPSKPIVVHDGKERQQAKRPQDNTHSAHKTRCTSKIGMEDNYVNGNLLTKMEVKVANGGEALIEKNKRTPPVVKPRLLNEKDQGCVVWAEDIDQVYNVPILLKVNLNHLVSESLWWALSSCSALIGVNRGPFLTFPEDPQARNMISNVAEDQQGVKDSVRTIYTLLPYFFDIQDVPLEPESLPDWVPEGTYIVKVHKIRNGNILQAALCVYMPLH